MDENGEAEGGGESLLVPESASAPPAVVGFEGYLHEDEYGEIIKRYNGASKSLMSELNTDGRPREFSFTPPTLS
jgi:hypothetical protein